MNHSDGVLEEIKNKQFVECPFGRVEYDEEDVLIFPNGLYGYENTHRYFVWKHEATLPFKWLICIDEPDLMFPVIYPKLVHPEYDPKLKNFESLDSLLVIVNMGRTMESVTANLRAPILISHEEHRAKQIILSDSNYSVRYRLIQKTKPIG